MANRSRLCIDKCSNINMDCCMESESHSFGHQEQDYYYYYLERYCQLQETERILALDGLVFIQQHTDPSFKVSTTSGYIPWGDLDLKLPQREGPRIQTLSILVLRINISGGSASYFQIFHESNSYLHQRESPPSHQRAHSPLDYFVCNHQWSNHAPNDISPYYLSFSPRK
uniref:Uncharacterized protein n=1 Tax=Spironucleus salmonicida TaxID=348837 RepID=V6LX13_9EUKA|eukprot:EST48778.1 Hypothetical protein SS50377_11015 [Spironucleus salmonicida]